MGKALATSQASIVLFELEDRAMYPVFKASGRAPDMPNAINILNLDVRLLSVNMKNQYLPETPHGRYASARMAFPHHPDISEVGA